MLKNLITLIIFCFSSTAFAFTTQQKDSLITDNGSKFVFVIHSVNVGETLYSLVNQYNCTVADVMRFNPSLNEQTGIKLGQVLKFPLIKGGKHVLSKEMKKVKPSAEKANKKPDSLAKKREKDGKKPEDALAKKEKPSDNSSEKEPTNKTSETNKTNGVIVKPAKYHIVLVNETLFSLAKFYNIEIDELVQANNIIGTNIRLGQKLLIEPEEIKKIIKKELVIKPKTLAFEKISNEKKITQQGIAEVINTNNRSNNYLALHHSAKVGSIIQVINEANGASIMAKVVGNLNKVGPDEETLIKLSPYAFFKLKPRDSKLRAKVIYYNAPGK
jgi:LysM repeat protein